MKSIEKEISREAKLVSVQDERLEAELNALGLHYVVGVSEAPAPVRLPPAYLLAGLANQKDARLRSALIALLLFRPSFAQSVSEALDLLDRQGQTTLKLFYTAAALLQQAHEKRLKPLVSPWQVLPDYFSGELGLPEEAPPLERLDALSQRHQAISGLAINWKGTYQHAAERLIKRLQKEAAWAI